MHIPNEEIKREFSRTIRGVRRNETIQRVRESDQIISDTVHMNADAVAAQIKKRNYPAAIKEFGGEILLVGINYDILDVMSW